MFFDDMCNETIASQKKQIPNASYLLLYHCFTTKSIDRIYHGASLGRDLLVKVLLVLLTPANEFGKLAQSINNLTKISLSNY